MNWEKSVRRVKLLEFKAIRFLRAKKIVIIFKLGANAKVLRTIAATLERNLRNRNKLPKFRGLKFRFILIVLSGGFYVANI